MSPSTTMQTGAGGRSGVAGGVIDERCGGGCGPAVVLMLGGRVMLLWVVDVGASSAADLEDRRKLILSQSEKGEGDFGVWFWVFGKGKDNQQKLRSCL